MIYGSTYMTHMYYSYKNYKLYVNIDIYTIYTIYDNVNIQLMYNSSFIIMWFINYNKIYHHII